MKKSYYVYEWFIVNTGEVFYVGKGKGYRFKQLKENEFFMKMYKTHECDVRKVFEGLTEHEAFEKEKELIKHYRQNSDYRLTNITDGGNQPPVHRGYETYNAVFNEESVKWVRNEYKNNPKSTLRSILKELKSKFGITPSRASLYDVIKNNSYVDSSYVPPSLEETRRRQIEYGAMSTKTNLVPIVRLSLEGKLIDEFDSITEASQVTGISISSIQQCIRKNTFQAQGFVFMREDEYLNTDIENIFKKRVYGRGSHNKKAVIQLTKEGKFVAEFESGSEAEKVLGIPSKRIHEVCKGDRRKSYKGHVFVWKSEYEKKRMA